MLATFCVRLALGLMLCLPLIWSCLPHPRFVRTQFLTALGLLAIATVSSWDEAEAWLLLGSTVLALVGAVAWTFDPAPGGRVLIVGLAIALTVALGSVEPATNDAPAQHFEMFCRMGNGLSSALLLGAAMTAMLVGHSYLIAPGLALTPLLRMHQELFGAIAIRAALSGLALALWTMHRGESTLNTEVVLWLPVRWVVGLVGPLGFGLMSYSAAKIRSTQSATGILYVVVVFTILGELLGLLLIRQTGLPL